MAQYRLSKTVIDKFRPRDRPYIVYDRDLIGFGLRVMPSGSKTWVVEYRPGAGGRKVAKRRMKIDGAKNVTADQARLRAKAVLSRVHLGEDPAGARSVRRGMPTVAEFTERFLQEACLPPNIKPLTKRLYRNNLRNFIIPNLGGAKLDAVTNSDVARLHRKIGKTMPTSANNVLVTFSSLFRFAAETGVLARGFNPVRGASHRFKTDKKERFLSPGEISRLAETLIEVESNGLPWNLTPNLTQTRAKHRAKPDRQRIEISPFVIAAIRLLLFTGCRRGEILTLKWAHVDLDGGVLRLADSKTGPKSVILNSPALAILSQLPRSGVFVIAGPNPDAPRPDITQQWYRIRKLAALDGGDGKPAFRLHDFRHNLASVGVGGGMGLPIIGKLLGHAHTATTQRYAHLDADPLRRAAESIGDVISSSMNRQRDNMFSGGSL